ncbi:MAG TPA: bifunctional fucokinase/fucose-1-phosphate guanylyltransferase [Candidatus Dormibacteraeota bacterium]|nr:bifunctional fucokinase/fucose-1-phosphate guanylyltransferase [Candidatus Dormibacteraeota bacterium]
MPAHSLPLQYLLTLPAQMAAEFETLENRPRPAWYASCDPPGRPLGSGGGTANLLAETWQATSPNHSFDQWLHQSRKLVIHGGGQSRRLPAYAATGKLLMPMPVLRWARGQRLDQSLLDLEVPDYSRVLRHASPGVVAMIASGDVVLRFGRDLPPFPEVDVLGLGMWVAPEKAQDFGVFFTRRDRPTELAFFLQKPPASKIRELADRYRFLVDTGMWLLSARAVRVLMERCGWDYTKQQFASRAAANYELYAQFGLLLGSAPVGDDAQVNALTSAVVALPEAHFYHFGTSTQIIDSVVELQNFVLDESKIGLTGGTQQPDQITQNSRFEATLRRNENRCLWIENSVVPATWHLASRHVLTGVPQNDWTLRLGEGTCLDFIPVGERDWCIRPYGFTDKFNGSLGEPSTTWLEKPASHWFESRGLSLTACGLDSAADIQCVPLFPILPESNLRGQFVQWLVAANAEKNPEFAALWQNSPRLSAQETGAKINLRRLYEQRSGLRQACLLPMLKHFRSSVFFRLDLESTARSFNSATTLPELEFGEHDDPMQLVHDRMFRAAVLRHHGKPGWEKFEAAAFGRLRDLIGREAQLSPALPRRNILEDQIVWARSPVRFDLAGGWTDTPPYCIEHGGKVLNLAVDLNGQPPIQVFAKFCDRPELVMRSIDLGLEERVRTYEELDAFAHPENPFALAKAALALAGFLPRFHAHGGSASLEQQLRSFGSGIELSLLSAVPKGSGLGTSSILAATVLAALGDLCGLEWDRNVLFTRTLALEQMLTTGGGWQDQAGAIFRGLKLIQTNPGLAQRPTLRWLPEHLLGHEYADRSILLYYTGVTRLAKNILAEIVRGLFLNSPAHLSTLADISANTDFTASALQRCDYSMLLAAIRNSWSLNQQLDSGTNPPAIQRILHSVADHTGAAKLLGAGGGGYLLLFGKDESAAATIKRVLLDNPPNARARFIEFTLSQTGLQLTRS